ncbi:MAG TPA: phosphate acyltransferase PlsX [Gammaproteobacteria bacterium]|nr:phosphate acyltransferase PlsX [Gammaproteobacteria bacterium]
MQKQLPAKTEQIIIAVDLMGGDSYPDERLDTLINMLKQQEDVVFRVFVSNSYLNTISHRLPSIDQTRIEFIACGRSVSMAESPFMALRQKRDSSLSMSIKDVAQKKSAICVTAGNTGAMVVLAKHWMNMLGEIDKPVLARLLPSRSKRALMLDVGATTDAKAFDLYNFARLGCAYQKAVYQKNNPEVALLNVGIEDNKGDDTVKQADAMLNESDINYIGYCEGTHLFNGYADVICCNGFVGNITIKACEAMASYIKNESCDSPKTSLWQKIKKGMRIVEPDEYNGALLLGLDGLVVKSHGNCNALAFTSAIRQAYNISQHDVIASMRKSLEN